MAKKPAWLYTQSAAIVWRRTDDDLEVLLVTSVRRGRWIVPKGVVERQMSPAESARKEAWEEAGVDGKISARAVGSYQYEKWGGICTVAVFLMEVTSEEEDWPERKVRRRRWMSFKKAMKTIENPELSEILGRALELLQRKEA
jgi:8-oxo-dGTP pyrophosphatase MutT (NUDIX family)